MNRKDSLLRKLLSPGFAAVLAFFASPLVSPLFAQGEQRAGGEANLVIPDLSSVSFFGVPGHTLLMAGLVVCGLGLLFGLVIYSRLKNMAVHESMRAIRTPPALKCSSLPTGPGEGPPPVGND